MANDLFMKILELGQVPLMESFLSSTKEEIHATKFFSLDLEYKWQGKLISTNSVLISLLWENEDMANYIIERQFMELQMMTAEYVLPDVEIKPKWYCLSRQWSPLSLGLVTTNVRLMEEMVERGLQLRDEDHHELLLLGLTAGSSLEQLRLLFTLGIKVCENSLKIAVQREDITQFRLLLRHPSSATITGKTALELICKSDSLVEFAKSLLEKKRDTIIGGDGKPLFIAASCGSLEIIKKILLVLPHEIFVKQARKQFVHDSQMRTPLHVALINKHYSVSRQLVAKGFTNDAPDFEECLQIILDANLENEFLPSLEKGSSDDVIWPRIIAKLLASKTSKLQTKLEDLVDEKEALQSCSSCKLKYVNPGKKRKRCLVDCGHCVCQECIEAMNAINSANSRVSTFPKCPICRKVARHNPIDIFDETTS